MAASTKEQDYHKVQKLSLGVFAADIGTGAIIGLTTAMPVAIIDTAVMRKVSGQSKSIPQDVGKGFKTLFTQPAKFFCAHPGYYYSTAYRAVYTTYGLTYMGGNVTRSFCEANGINYEMPVLLATGSINTILTVWKDSIFLKIPEIVGAKRGKAYIPLLSKCMFAARDVSTCAAAFVIVDHIAKYVREYNPDMSIKDSKKVGQCLGPTILQFFSTPVHITSITYSNYYPNCQLRDVQMALSANYFSASFSRMGRIIPSFVIGGMGNTELRSMTTSFAEKNGY